MYDSTINAPSSILTVFSSAIPKMTVLRSIIPIPEAEFTKKNWEDFVAIKDPVRDDDDFIKLTIKMTFTNNNINYSSHVAEINYKAQLVAENRM